MNKPEQFVQFQESPPAINSPARTSAQTSSAATRRIFVFVRSDNAIARFASPINDRLKYNINNWLTPAGIGAVFLAGGALLGATRSVAQSTAKIVVPVLAGGSADTIARLAGQKVEEQGGPKVIVENKPGGAGVPAALAVKDTPADGATLLFGEYGMLITNVTLMKDLPYDPVKDFEALTILCEFPSILSVPANLPVNSVADLVGLARNKPGGLFTQ